MWGITVENSKFGGGFSSGKKGIQCFYTVAANGKSIELNRRVSAGDTVSCDASKWRRSTTAWYYRGIPGSTALRPPPLAPNADSPASHSIFALI